MSIKSYLENYLLRNIGNSRRTIPDGILTDSIETNQ